MNGLEGNLRITFHCGLPKTGSTFLQKAIFPYCRGGAYVHGKRGFTYFVSFLSCAREPVLVSDERLAWTPLGRDEYESKKREQMLGYVARTWPGSNLLLFLREPSEMIKSYYAQHLHVGGSSSFVEFYTRHIHYDAMRFEILLDTIAEQSWNDVLLIEYQDLINKPERTTQLIEEFTGLRFPGWNIKIRGRFYNSSVDGYGAGFLKLCNKSVAAVYGSEWIRTHRKVEACRHKVRQAIQGGPLRYLNRIGPPLVTAGVLADIKQRYQMSWKEVQRRIAASQVGRLVDSGSMESEESFGD